MLKIKLIIDNDKTFHFFDITNEIKIDIPNLIPSKHKLFHNDVIYIKESSKTIDASQSIIHESPMRDSILAGVLVTNKTYGRSGRRLLYKCIPDNARLPSFLVPYDIPPSFNKAIKNKYIVFRFVDWDSDHPHGEIKDTLGDVDSIEAFYQYQLWRKNLNNSISQFSAAARKRIGSDESIYIKQIMEKWPVEDYRKFGNVFSIDPHGCTDFDDAFSVIFEDNFAIVNVYIANVYLWLETYELWEFMTDRVSTIYLPCKKVPLLPSILSDKLCSLEQGHDRFAFMMSLKFDMTTRQPVGKTVYKNVLIRVNKNYVYEDPTLRNNPAYRILRTLASTDDSHEVVSYWMIKMNTECAKYLSDDDELGIFRGQGIFRGSTTTTTTTTTCSSFFLFENCASSYSQCATPHLQLGVESYVHITSPIRRLVDILNQILFMKTFYEISENCQAFFDKWFAKLDYINRVSKDIRRVQMDCELLALCTNNSDLVNREFFGVVFDKHEISLNIFEYSVYIEELKLMTRFVTDKEILTKGGELTDKADSTSLRNRFKILIFNDENKLCKKIRILMV
jgi:exoribonuclease R